MCNKISYNDQATARLKASKFCIDFGHPELYVYYCLGCQAWHISRSGPSKIGLVTAKRLFSERYVELRKTNKLKGNWM